MGSYIKSDVNFMAPLVAARMRAGGGRRLTESELALCAVEVSLLVSRVNDVFRRATVELAAIQVEVNKGHPLTSIQIQACQDEVKAMERHLAKRASSTEPLLQRWADLRQEVAVVVDGLNLQTCLEQTLPSGADRSKPRM